VKFLLATEEWGEALAERRMRGLLKS